MKVKKICLSVTLIYRLIKCLFTSDLTALRRLLSPLLAALKPPQAVKPDQKSLNSRIGKIRAAKGDRGDTHFSFKDGRKNFIAKYVFTPTRNLVSVVCSADKLTIIQINKNKDEELANC